MRTVYCIVMLIVGVAVKANILPLQEADTSLYTKPLFDSDYMTYDFTDVEEENPVVGNDCFPEKIECDSNLNRREHEPICAYSTKYGLTNYFSLCEINLQICLLDLQKYGNIRRRQFDYGDIYYNGLPHPCAYYQRRSTTGPEAIELYYKLGAQYNSN
ncbi:uncharacterized protein LOC118270385 [Spodoptera frugiperda]|uniref:Uncharacterized protein LOC118270385 n=1 Tax=Spodoptera frugiperda TaxID=7108 RepID=A0A9R0D6E9_SPOFR|nr:uncharacterized protein LOC118270385 [Spodoptera frugiperda]